MINSPGRLSDEMMTSLLIAVDRREIAQMSSTTLSTTVHTHDTVENSKLSKKNKKSAGGRFV